MERLRFLWRIHHNFACQFHYRRHNFQQIGVLTGICYGKGHAITNINTMFMQDSISFMILKNISFWQESNFERPEWLYWKEFLTMKKGKSKSSSNT